MNAKKIYGLVLLVGVLVAVGLLTLTAFRHPGRFSGPAKPYTLKQAADKISSYEDKRLVSAHAKVASARCLRVVKSGSSWAVGKKGHEFACIVNIVDSTGATALCGAVSFSLPAGAAEPTVDTAQKVDTATYCG